jgi:hypothetical protein
MTNTKYGEFKVYLPIEKRLCSTHGLAKVKVQVKKWFGEDTIVKQVSEEEEGELVGQLLFTGEDAKSIKKQLEKERKDD